MTADLRRRSPLEHLVEAMGSASAGDVELRELPFLSQVDLRAEPGDLPGLALPTTPNTVLGDDERSALWLGPDEWLVVGRPDTEEETQRELRAALGGSWGSVVDVSAQRTTVELGGPRARDVLAAGCSLDLHPWHFAAGHCAQTTLARAQVILWQVSDEPRYRLLVGCSLAGYLVEWLLDAMGEPSEVRR